MELNLDLWINIWNNLLNKEIQLTQVISLELELGLWKNVLKLEGFRILWILNIYILDIVRKNKFSNKLYRNDLKLIMLMIKVEQIFTPLHHLLLRSLHFEVRSSLGLRSVLLGYRKMLLDFFVLLGRNRNFFI